MKQQIWGLVYTDLDSNLGFGLWTLQSARLRMDTKMGREIFADSEIERAMANIMHIATSRWMERARGFGGVRAMEYSTRGMEKEGGC